MRNLIIIAAMTVLKACSHSAIMNPSSNPVKALEKQRDFFVFQSLVGCRISDLYAMTRRSIINGAVEYIPRKTKDGRPVVVRVPFLSENLQLTLCHYPMVTWNKKPHGSIMLHGHCHGKLDEHNRLSSDLRFDVGIDGELAKRAEGLIPLELIYEAAMEKTGGVPFMCPMLAH